ncbi:hypothetical protein PF005_g5025 [Phytophthora fragariae]|uniref:Uncharacterized protein n=1 Tax=Phytophthora fragariae TaxID=53985 RepID=A0A6A3YXT3_9STRA|nr:hypothetical protein PF005_g5025 [Phytophthora fragariae]
MKRRDSSSDAALRELERALDAFMATHVATAANALATMATKNGVEDVGDLNKPFVDEDDAGDAAVDAVTNSVQKEVSTDMANFQRDLKRLQCLSSVITSTRRRRGPSSIVSIARLLLTWLQAVESSSAAAAASSSAVVGGALPPPSAAEAARAAELVQQQSPIDPVASWLVATLLRIAFRPPQTPSNVEISSNERAAVDELVALTAARCFLAFQRAWQADEETQRRARAESSGTLFSYLTMRKTKPKSQSSSGPTNALAVCLGCTTEAGVVWGHVLGLAVCLAPDVSRMKLQNEILARAAVWNATKPSTGSGDIAQHPYLKHLSHIRLGLAPSQAVPNATLSSRMSGAARWLRVVMPLLLKPHRSHVRSACAHLISQMLIRELDSLDRLELSVLYTSTGSDWSRCISDLHAAALRLTDCAKKKGRGRAQQHLEASSWSLRAVALALAPGEIFTRYWNDDTLALLRLQQQLNQDSSAGGAATYNVLPSLELSFTYMMHRHFLLRDSGAAKTGAPTSSDCEGTINTTQAWVFFSLQRLRPQTPSSASICSFTALKTIALPALVRVSRAIASYNMACTVQNHLRPLLSEPVRVGDPQMLIGLEALADLLSQNDRDDNTRLSFRVNSSDLLASRQMIGELVGRVLLACSTQIGHTLLTEVPAATKNRDALQLGELRHNTGDDDEEEHWKDPTQAVAVATFAAALALMPPLYAHLALSNEQKLRLLVRTSINAELSVHRRAHEALLALIGPQSPHSTDPPPPGAGMVVRELTDHIMRMNANNPVAVGDAAGAIVILRLLSDLLEPSRATTTRWESPQDRYAALIQVEAVAVYLLARGDDNIEAEQSLRVTALETLEVAHEARVACCEQPSVRSSVQLPLVDRPSVWTLLGDLDSDLKTAFFSFGPETAEDTRPDQPVDKHSAFRRLILDTTDRHSFRWSLCLARVFRSLARRAPDVIAYIWTDVVDKVAKLEPVLSVTPVPGDSLQQNQRELARWRNLALLATVSACPILQSPTRKAELSSFCSENASSCPSEPPSVAPSAMVATLVRQLACYLRSTNVGQRNAAVLALGHAGSVALPTLLEVLARLEGEVFTAPSSNGEQDAPDGNSLTTSTLQRIRSPRPTKLPKKKLLELQHARIAQFSLQWAVGRCYRILLESRTREHDDNEELEPGGPMTERLRRVVSAFLAKMTTTFEDVTNSSVDNSEASDGTLSFNSSAHVLDENPLLLMVQLDFIALLRALLLHSNAAVKPAVQLPHDKLAALLLSWSGSFDKDLAGAAVTGYLHASFVAPETGCELYSHWMKQCDVHTARDGKLVFPWIWIDSQHQLLGSGGSSTEACMASRSVAQYFICHRAFSTLTELLRSSLKSADGTGTWDGDSVATWLDACFSVDGVAFSHFNDLHQLAQRALHVLLELPPGTARFNHVVKRCFEKATYPFSSADKSALRVARHYLEALGASNEVMSFFRSLLLRLQERRVNIKDGEESYLAVRLLHVLLLHVGVQLDDKLVHQHRQVALDMAAALVCEPGANCDDDESAATRWGLQGYYSPALEGLVAGRLQVSVSALLASRFSVLSLRVSLAVLRSMPDSTLQNRDDITQQRQMLAAVLPWLAEVPLWTPNEPSNRSTELLDLLFGLTTALGGTCGEQLDHIWLTLAFASTGGDDTNLGEIVNFLFRQQRKSQLPSETAKMVMWWLCRWQDAAPDVLRLLLLQLPLMAAKEPDPSEVATALNELAALVTLAGDTSCHLLQAGANSSNADVRALAVHLVHIALSTLFALLESDNVDEIASNSITQHCHVLLHSVLPLLEAPRGLLAAALALIKASTSRINIDERNTQSSSLVQREEFLEALRALAVCLSATEIQIWSELCVQEIAMTISLETSSTSESLETRRRPSPPHEVCIRFALVAYNQLSPRFQGDVLLSILTLLRQTLTAGVEDTPKSRPSSLARECLALLAMLIQSMPMSRLVLYPQVFWVALALLTHCRQQRDHTPSSSLSLHAGALEVLSILWDRTPFSSHPVVQDVIRGTRPAQWESTTARNSVLMEIVRCVYSDEGFDSRTRALEMLRKAVLLVPRDLLGVSACEHLVICTLALLPALIIPSSEANNSRKEANSDCYTRDDLVVLWQTAGAPDQLVGLLQMREFTLSGRDSFHKLAATFMAAYVPALYSLEHEDNGVEFDGLKLSLEVLVACLPQPAGPQTRESPRLESSGAELNDERCNFVFVLLDELLRDVFRRKQSNWRPVPELEAALARLLRSPQTERQWRASVRVLSWVAELAKVTGTTGSSVSPLPVPSTARRSLPGGKSSEMITSLGRIAESEDDLPPGHSSAYLGSQTAAGDAHTLKKTPSTRALQRFASPRSRISGSISRTSRNTGGNNNNELPRSSEPPSMKKQHLSEQPGNEHEDHSLSGDGQPTADA